MPLAREVAIRGDLVARVLGVEIAGELNDPLEVSASLTRRGGLQRPRDGGFGANVVLAADSGKLGESVQVPLVLSAYAKI